MLNWLWAALGYTPPAATQTSNQPEVVAHAEDNIQTVTAVVPEGLQFYAMLADQNKRSDEQAIKKMWDSIQRSLTQHDAFTETLINEWRKESNNILCLLQGELSPRDEQAIQKIQTLSQSALYFLNNIFLEHKDMIDACKYDTQKFSFFFLQDLEKVKNRESLASSFAEIIQCFQDTTIIKPGHYQLMIFNTALQLLANLQKYLSTLIELISAMRQNVMKLSEVDKLKNLIQVSLQQHITNQIYQFHYVLKNIYQFTLPKRRLGKK